jgi:hypothetical protein
MPKRRRSSAGKESAAAKPAGRWARPDIKHTSVYLPEAAYEALRQVAFDERRKIHDLSQEALLGSHGEARDGHTDITTTTKLIRGIASHGEVNP